MGCYFVNTLLFGSEICQGSSRKWALKFVADQHYSSSMLTPAAHNHLAFWDEPLNINTIYHYFYTIGQIRYFICRLCLITYIFSNTIGNKSVN